MENRKKCITWQKDQFISKRENILTFDKQQNARAMNTSKISRFTEQSFKYKMKTIYLKLNARSSSEIFKTYYEHSLRIELAL